MHKNSFIILKVLTDTDILNWVKQSLDTNKERYYVVNENSKQVIEEMAEEELYSIFILEFKIIEEGQEPICLYSGNCKRSIARNGSPVLTYQINFRTESRLVMDNFSRNMVLNLVQDFKAGEYLFFESSSSVLKQMNFIINPPYSYLSLSTKKVVYKKLQEEESLHELAQKNQYCQREYSILSPQEDRSEFQRDYERIIHSRAFRRIVDKAQIFSAKKGDHFRTRMTHTLAVTQIARGIAKSLNMNTYLTEAIALGHDLGHTPFGHQGERTLQNILNGNIQIIDCDIEGKSREEHFAQNPYGGFKHNYQALRVVSQLEEEYIEFNGLDLSYQCLDGILKHTTCDQSKYNLNEFISKAPQDFILQKSFPLTVEGQIVAVADEIAQRSHDLEDAFSSDILTYRELIESLSLNKMDKLKTEVTNLECEFEKVKARNRCITNEEELLYSRISSRIIHFFIEDVIRNSKKCIEDYLIKDGTEFSGEENDHKVIKKLVDFSQEGKMLCEYLENIIRKKVINSLEVSQFDHNGATVVEGLFRIYYQNPRLLHRGTVRRIMWDIRKHTDNVIDFTEASSDLVQQEWGKISRAPISENEYRIKRKILVRNIADFISGMTDSYAINEYCRYY